MTNHYGLQLSTNDLHRLTLWLDCNSDFFGADENTLAQAQGQIVQPINPLITGYQTVTNTVYGPAIPAVTAPVIGNNNGLSVYGTPLQLAAPQSGVIASQPVTLGQLPDGGFSHMVVAAGPDQATSVGSPGVLLNGSVTINGHAPFPGSVAVGWSVVTGPANVNFGNPAGLSTMAAFSQPGSYLLRLSAASANSTNSANALITVMPTRQPPLVYAGPDRILSDGETSAVLAGRVLDYSLPATSRWSQVSGPGKVVFTSPVSPSSTVQFPTTGIYVLSLTASDGFLSATDTCTIQLVPPVNNSPPNVFAGNDISTSYTNNPVTLQGSATDAGFAGTLTATWSVISGPGTVIFGNSNSPSTTANFSQMGYYLLQLTTTAGGNTAYDQLAVNLYPGDGSLHFGSITREYWGGITGDAVSDLTSSTNYPDNPDWTTNITSFEVPDGSGNDYGTRVHGYLYVPVTGYYTFWLESDDNGELWLSTSTNQAAATLIASVPEWTDWLEWDKFPSQQSTPVLLQAGQICYIKALQKQGSGGDHVAVAWQGPGFDQTVIDGAYLAPIPAPVPPRGTITREYWTGIAGTAVSDLTSSPDYPDTPSGTQTLTNFEAPTDWDTNYGDRIQALLYPPASGTYTFWIASDDNSELWLSTNARPENATLIASVPGWTNPRAWATYRSQQSSPVNLQSNQVYFIMALHKQGGGGDNLSVAWWGPDFDQTVIDGQYLSDYADIGVTNPPPSEGPVVLGLNQPPQVDAGPDQETSFQSNLVVLSGRAVDDGLPLNPGVLTVQWSKQGGPGDVIFSNASAACTCASFSAPGQYLLRLDANDGELTDSATVAITVTEYSEYSYFYPSPQDLAFSPDGKTLAVADEGLKRVLLVDRASRRVLQRVPVEGTPRGLAWENAGSLWVCEYDAGSVADIDPVQGQVVRRLTVGPKPSDVKVDSNRGRLVVVDFGLAQVSIVDLASGGILTNVPAVAEPMYVTLTPDLSTALVANSEPAGDARGAAYAASVTLINLNTFATSQIQLPPGSTSLRGVAVTPDGRWACVAHLLGRAYLPTSQLNSGWMVNNVVSFIDLTAGQVYATVPLDQVKNGAANPWGLTLSDNGRTLWVCASSVDEVIRLDLGSILGYLAANPQNQTTMDTNLLMLYQNGWVQRLGSVGTGPRGISMSPDGHTLAVASYFSGEVHLLDTVSNAVTDVIAAGFSPPEHALRRGERLYYDANGCYQRWLSCSTCHPGGRADGLNWDLLNDGLGNAKNTLSHVFSTVTPPSMRTGVRASAAVAIAAGFKYIEFQQHSDQDQQDVYDYMNSLRPEPSPYLNKGFLTVSALRGKALFQNPVIGCATCHSGPYFTDLQLRNVGTGHPGDVGPYDPIYKTTTLDELWRTGPYLHDGSAPTLQDVLTTQNSNNLHGVTTQLSSSQIGDLVAYLNQIGGIDNWTNQAPAVFAGRNEFLILPAATAQLSAVAEDDGLPYGILNVSWTLQNGPAPVVFGNSNQPATTATFTQPGAYTLACTADDGQLQATNSLVISVAALGTSVDSNSNGIADAWEYYYFGGLNVPKGGPNDDFDGDGLSNMYKYVTGTDPTDPNAAFLVNIIQENGQIVVSFHAAAAGTVLTPGTRLFTLQRGVLDGNGQIVWNNVPGYTGIQGADQDVQLTETGPATMELYRVLVSLNP
jgi:6-phosphogluconolactonase (cycloisomerase 2 family)